jgi:hypothetical protein
MIFKLILKTALQKIDNPYATALTHDSRNLRAVAFA